MGYRAITFRLRTSNKTTSVLQDLRENTRTGILGLLDLAGQGEHRVAVEAIERPTAFAVGQYLWRNCAGALADVTPSLRSHIIPVAARIIVGYLNALVVWEKQIRTGQNYAQILARIDELLKNGRISAERHAKAKKKIPTPRTKMTGRPLWPAPERGRKEAYDEVLERLRTDIYIHGRGLNRISGLVSKTAARADTHWSPPISYVMTKDARIYKNGDGRYSLAIKCADGHRPPVGPGWQPYQVPAQGKRRKKDAVGPRKEVVGPLTDKMRGWLVILAKISAGTRKREEF